MGAWSVRLLVLLTLATPAVLALGATDKPGDLQARFDRETNSVHKAKIFEKLGDAQFQETRRAAHANDYVAVGLVMEKYRDNARAVFDALKSQHSDAERHMNGYKQLQIHVHRALREIDDTLISAPAEYKPPLQLVRHDLLSLDDGLLKLLFPRRTEEKSVNPIPEAAPPEKQL
jgi:hypothetical protein